MFETIIGVIVGVALVISMVNLYGILRERRQAYSNASRVYRAASEHVLVRVSEPPAALANIATGSVSIGMSVTGSAAPMNRVVVTQQASQ